MRVPAILSSLALASAAVLVAAPASAAPPQPTCGSTLTVDTALRADLVCAGPGLVLGPDVDLNLRGHTLRGTAGGVGLDVTSTGSATIKNGTLSGWDAAVNTLVIRDDEGFPVGGGPLVVDRVSFRNNGTGIDGVADIGAHAKDVTVSRSSFTNNGVGLIAEGIMVNVDHSIFTGNTEIGYQGNYATTATITDSLFVRNAKAVSGTEAAVEVRRSTFIDNPQAVVSWGNISQVTIADSRLIGSDLAVDGSGTDLSVTGSTFVANTTAAFVGPFGGTFASNTFRANQTTISIDPEWSGTAITVRDNTFRLNGDGLRLEGEDAASASIGGNDARFNTGWGIYAPGAIDLGGNSATHNGNEPQCVGVVCP